MTFCLKMYKVYGNIAMGSIVFEIIFLFFYFMTKRPQGTEQNIMYIHKKYINSKQYYLLTERKRLVLMSSTYHPKHIGLLR